MNTRQANIARATLAALGACGALAASEADDPPVQVIVDMNPAEPGYQSSVTVSPCEQVVEIDVYLLDPLGLRTVWSIGFLGGIDRGIAFGHVPNPSHGGAVTGITGTPRLAANPGSQAFVIPSFALIHTMAGPEVQYVEWSSAERPAVISAQPAAPLFSASITLQGTEAGEFYDFHLVDAVTLSFGAGAFSTLAPLNSLDTGGDAVPDDTLTLQGVDADRPVPVPPASYLVDYIDGASHGGPATIHIAPIVGDLAGDCEVGGEDLGVLLLAWGACPRDAACPPDLTGDGVVDGADLGILLLNWTS